MFSAPSIAVGRPPVAGGARRHPRRRGRFHAWVVADTYKKDVSPDETTRKDQATTQRRKEQRRNNAVAAGQGGNVLRRGTRLPDQSPYMQAQATRAGSFAALAVRNFGREFGGLVDTLRTPFVLRDPRETVKMFQRDDDETPSFRGEMPECFGFTLDNEAILAYDKDHPAPGPAPVPAPVQVLYDVLLFFVDRLYEGRAIERFWFLETVARMPYFAYTTCLHLYETMGWYRAAELRRWGGCRDVPRERLGTTETCTDSPRRVHFAEEWNELHHLLIMESMGGDKRWVDRFLGQHAAVFYYWVLVLVFFASPSWSYKFSEMLETHAVSTYGEFIRENAEVLAALPAPDIARAYYRDGDLYMFDADSHLVRSAVGGDPRRAPVNTMLDVFNHILADELEHVKTMALCQDYDSLEKLVSAGERAVADDVAGGGVANQDAAVTRADADLEGRPKSTASLLDPASRRRWTEWADRVNRDYGGSWVTRDHAND